VFHLESWNPGGTELGGGGSRFGARCLTPENRKIQVKNTVSLSYLRSFISSDEKFPEIFTGGNFPETFPTMFAHPFLLIFFYLLSMFRESFRKVSGMFPEIFIIIYKYFSSQL
jgi:hypothetical protein